MKRETLVLIPGLLCDATVWTAQCDALAPLADCVVADLGDCGSIREMATRVLASVDGTVAVAGHSMGGRVALEMMRLAPERIARLALLDTGYQPLAAGEAGERERAGRRALVALAREQGMRAMGRAWAPGMVLDENVGTPVFERILDMIERSTPARFEAQIGALLARPDAEPLLARIACPTVLICGREDRWSPLARHEAMQAAVPGATLSVIERSGHMSTMEQPEAVSAALAEWLARPAVEVNA